MNRYIFHLPRKYKLRGFEEELALMELRVLGAVHPERTGNTFVVESELTIPNTLLERLTFFEQVVVEKDLERETIVPYQVLLDRTARSVRLVGKIKEYNSLRNAIQHIENGRREHTYLTHSYHQYKGKFYPQLVKALMNYAGIRAGDVVLDPFVGSGTTLVECFINGVSGVGVDLNPLAVLMSNVKVGAFKLDPSEVEIATKHLREHLKRSFKQTNLWDLGLEDWTQPNAPKWDFDNLLSTSDLPNKEYLLRWFPEEALAKYSIILHEISKLEDPDIQDFCRLTLSDTIRPYSLQEPKQLRIRRRKDIPNCQDILLQFFRSLNENKAAIHLYRAVRSKCPQGDIEVTAFQGDIRNLRDVPTQLLRDDAQIDAVITSPPYATALPYIDTDRLSLFLLGLLDVDNRWKLEGEMIGNREIRDGQRQALEDEFLSYYDTNPLPESTKALIRGILTLNQNAQVGFRRKNVASLLYKYFSDMRQGFAEVFRVLKPGGLFFVIIGNSTTTAGGKLIEIPTDQFLMDIGKSLGFVVDASLPMTDQAAYMIHNKNKIRTETIFGLRKPTA